MCHLLFVILNPHLIKTTRSRETLHVQRRLACKLTQLSGGFRSYLEHLPDFLFGQIDVEFVEQLVNLSDAQGAVSVFVSLRESLL